MDRRLVVLREEARWLMPPLVRMAYGLTGFPRAKAIVMTAWGLGAGWVVNLTGWFGRLTLMNQVVGLAAVGLFAAGLLGIAWHWIEGRFLGNDAKRQRLAAFYYRDTVCALDHTIRMWATIRDPNRSGASALQQQFAALFASMDGIVAAPIVEHRLKLEGVLENPAAPLRALVEAHQTVFQFHWRALLWIHATMGFVGLTPDSEQYRAMMDAHDKYSRSLRILALQPGFRTLGKVLRTLNREREMVVTPWTVRYE